MECDPGGKSPTLHNATESCTSVAGPNTWFSSRTQLIGMSVSASVADAASSATAIVTTMPSSVDAGNEYTAAGGAAGTKRKPSSVPYDSNAHPGNKEGPAARYASIAPAMG